MKSLVLSCIFFFSAAAFCADATRCAWEADPSVALKIRALFEKVVVARHGTAAAPKETPVRRPVFLKPHGVMVGTFTPVERLPKVYRQGVFAGGPVKAWVRISSDTIPATSDHANSTVGFAIKILTGRAEMPTQDFLLQNHHVFFVDKGLDFLEFTEASLAGKAKEYFAAHPVTDQILNRDMDKRVENALSTTYWSTTPYRLGASDYVKYRVVPCRGNAGVPPGFDGPNYLHDRLNAQMAAQGACFELQAQLRKGEMPLDRATVNWDETVSKPRTVAILNFGPQELASNAATGENFSFAATHTLPEHEPVGSVNFARAVAYQYFADLRRSRNGMATAEPNE